ncbi:MAG TPA: TIGR03435 family protein [Vicinamibacterales bacterium]
MPTFEVASVKSSKSAPMNMMTRILPGRLEATNMPLRMLITQAYRVLAYQLQGGPSWLDSDRFDIAAKAPDGSTPDQTILMLRALLVERFRLKVHTETKEAPTRS